MKSNVLSHPRLRPFLPYVTTGIVISVVFIALEIWRPYYFLTDDNLTFFYCLSRELGARWMAGQGIGITDSIYGGGYQTARDIVFLVFRGPVGWLALGLGASRYHLAVADAYAGVHLLLAGWTFLALLDVLERRPGRRTPLSPSRKALLAISYTLSGYALIVGSSWCWYLGNLAALPVVAAGLFLRQGSWGTAIVTLGLAYSLVGGHVHPAAWTFLLGGAFATSLAIIDRSWRPAGVYALGASLALLLLFPLLAPALEGLRQSPRAQALAPEIIQQLSFSPLQLFSSLFFGTVSYLWVEPVPLFELCAWHCAALASCLAAWKAFEGDAAPEEERALKRGLLAAMAVLTLLMWRPNWLNEILLHLPVFRSLRWPFKEYLFFLFAFHVWLALRPPRVPALSQRRATLVGVVIFVFSMAVPPAPSFMAMEATRQAIMTGRHKAFREWLEPSLSPSRRIVSAIPVKPVVLEGRDLPYLFTGSYNFAALLDVVSISGYTTAPYRRDEKVRFVPGRVGGTVGTESLDDLRRQDPGLTVLELLDTYPFVIRVTAPDGTTREWREPPDGD